MKRILASLLVILMLPSCYSCGGCFLAGTEISTPKGPVAIETLEAGSEVYAYDNEQGVIVKSVVEEVITREVSDYLVITLSDERVLQVTSDHPLGVSGRDAFKKAGDLAIGDEVVVSENDENTKNLKVKNIKTIKAPTTVYNLRVRRYNNSFAAGVLAYFY